MKKIISLLFVVVCVITSCNTSKNQNETIVVASQQADCVGVGPQKCFLIKEGDSKDWTFWYSGIEGFNYEPGYEYVIEIRKDTVANPPMDASTIKYTFLKEVSKTKKESEDMPSISM